MKSKIYNVNKREFLNTCSMVEIKETEKCLYKYVSMFGAKTLIFWKHSARISTRVGHNNKNL